MGKPWPRIESFLHKLCMAEGRGGNRKRKSSEGDGRVTVTPTSIWFSPEKKQLVAEGETRRRGARSEAARMGS